jgi:outer membrane protein OmpA-like peptidoglycan-associated protein
MQRQLKVKNLLSCCILSGAIACATANPPQELVDARTAYNDAEHGPAQQYKPDELRKAKVALDLAEISLKDNGAGEKTQTLSYVAERRAQEAAAQGATAQALAQLAQTQAAYYQATGMALKDAQSQLANAQKQLAASELARREAEAQAREAMDKLAAASVPVKEEARGIVITLSGSVLFASGKTTLLPAAQTKLNEVAEALRAEANHKIIVQGHTDSTGSDAKNQELSTRRAEAVRAYLITRGVDPAQITAVGLGSSQPVADNGTAEGRADNRRVEIVVQPLQASAPGQEQPASVSNATTSSSR